MRFGLPTCKGGEFVNRDTYIDELLDTLAGKLNSNEEFHPDRGLQIEVVLVRMPTPGSGRGRKREVGFRPWPVDSEKKYNIIRITNQDTLCCARAIVTVKAWLHRNDTTSTEKPRSGWNSSLLFNLPANFLSSSSSRVLPSLNSCTVNAVV